MSQSNELRENIHGMIYDKAIEYANGHVVNFYEVVDDIMDIIQAREIDAVIYELEKTMPHTDGMRHYNTDYNTVNARLKTLKDEIAKLRGKDK